MINQLTLEQNEINFSPASLRKLIIPILIEQILAISVGMADSVMVAHVSETAVSAVSLVDSISNLLIRAFAGFATGGAIIAGQYLGKGENDSACRVAKQLTLILFWVSIGIMLLLYVFSVPILNGSFGKAEDAVMRDTFIYYNIVTMSVPFMAIYNCASALLRIMKRSDLAFRISLIMNVINLIGNAFLIYGLGMGVEGAAIPTVISRLAAAVMIFVVLQDRKHPIRLNDILKFKHDAKTAQSIVRLGSPYALENGMFHFGRFVLTSLISSLGTASIVANAIGGTLGTFQNCASVAIGMGLTTVVSQCVGAGRFDKAREYTLLLLKFDYLIQLIINTAILLAMPIIARLYGISGHTVTLMKAVLIIHGVTAIILHPTAFPLADVLRSAGDAKYTSSSAIISMWICRVLLSYVFHYGFGWGLVGVYTAHALDWVFRSIAYISRYRSSKWEKSAV